MELIKKTASEMVWHTPISYKSLKSTLTLCALTWLGVSVTYLTSGQNIITCTRPQPTAIDCQIDQNRPLNNFLGTPSVTVPDVQAAILRQQVHHDTDGDTYTLYQAALVNGKGIYPITNFTRSDITYVSDQMNHLLATDIPTWEIVTPDKGIGVIVVGCLILLGSTFLMLSTVQKTKEETLTLEKATGQYTYTITGAFGLGRKIEHYPLDTLTITLQATKDSDGDAYYEMCLIQGESNILYQKDDYSRQRLENLYHHLCDFLGVETKEILLN